MQLFVTFKEIKATARIFLHNHFFDTGIFNYVCSYTPFLRNRSCFAPLFSRCIQRMRNLMCNEHVISFFRDVSPQWKCQRSADQFKRWSRNLLKLDSDILGRHQLRKIFSRFTNWIFISHSHDLILPHLLDNVKWLNTNILLSFNSPL